MGKRKEAQATNEDDPTTDPLHRKHKKHKKKHKHRRSEPEERDAGSPEVTSPKTSIKLKLKIGGETLGTKNVTSIDPASRSSYEDTQDDAIINVTDDQWDSSSGFGGHGEGSGSQKKFEGSSDEEQAWLDALEAGELDDYGEIPKTRDPSLLTVRQATSGKAPKGAKLCKMGLKRALLHGHQVELQQLPSGYKTVELTEEQLQRRQQRAKKRRQQAHEKREKDKKQTLERLLKKQETKSKGPKGRGSKRTNIPRVRYLNNMDGISVSIPQGHPFPFPSKAAALPKPPVFCGVEGCKNVKLYTCAKTKVPLCSLKCYRKNLTKAETAGQNVHNTEFPPAAT